MEKRIQFLRKRKKQKPSLWWLLAIPPAALSVAWGVRKAIESGRLTLRRQRMPGMVPATGIASPPHELERADFREVASELTVQEMADFQPNRPERAQSIPSAPPMASEDSPVEKTTRTQGMQPTEGLRGSDISAQSFSAGASPEMAQPPAEPMPETNQRSFQADLPSEDFRVIEGIGPSINAILHNAGIQTYQQLADAPVDDLREILRRAGLTHLADPGTWSEQARMAADAKWEELSALQASLRHGRRQD